jgi:phosphoribosyl-ATP pyrophosphohydrolase
MDIIEQLTAILRERKSADANDSYVASLYEAGINKILEKVGEEATEVVIAGKEADGSGRDEALVREVADLWFHSMVLLVYREQDPAWVLAELERRFGTSGLDEKAGR